MGDFVGVQCFDLNMFYFKIFVDSIDWQLVVDFMFVVNFGLMVVQFVDMVEVCSFDFLVIFLIMDEFGLRLYYDFYLIDLNNNVIVVGVSVGGVLVQVSECDNYCIVKVIFFDFVFVLSYVGEWKFMLVFNGKWKLCMFGVVYMYNNLFVGGNDLFFNGYNGFVLIGFGVVVVLNYCLNVSVMVLLYEFGLIVMLKVDFFDCGWLLVIGIVMVDVIKFDGLLVIGIVFYDDGMYGDVVVGDGMWMVVFGQMVQLGSY